MRTAAGILTGVVTALLLVACGGDPVPTVTGAVSSTPSPTVSAVGGPAATEPATTPAPPGTAAAAADCAALHAAVLADLDALALAAEEALGDLTVEDAIGDMVTTESADGFPAPFRFLDDLAPLEPWGGVVGPEAEARYVELGCTPDDEYPAIRAWFGVGPGATGDDLGNAVTERLTSGAAGAVALPLGRRLLEGDPDSDDTARIVAALEAAATAQQAIHDRTGTFTEAMGDLVDAGMPPAFDDVTSEVFVMVLQADADAYCMTAAAERGVGYVESHDHTPVVESRPGPGVACASTFPDLD